MRRLLTRRPGFLNCVSSLADDSTIYSTIHQLQLEPAIYVPTLTRAALACFENAAHPNTNLTLNTWGASRSLNSAIRLLLLGGLQTNSGWLCEGCEHCDTRRE